MFYHSSPSVPSLQEPPSFYSPFSRKNTVYEVSLRAASPWLKELSNTHRLVQALLRGDLLGNYEIWDFLIWPEGILFRLSLGKTPSLAELLKFLKEKSVPAESRYRDFWEDEPRSIRLVQPEKIAESNRFFLDAVESLRYGTGGSWPSPFFFYRHPRLRR
jgi:hypothetical protein